MKTISSRQRHAARPMKVQRATAPHHGNGHTTSTTREVTPEVARWLGRPKLNLINGRWVPAVSGKTFDLFNPADAADLTRVADRQHQDIDEAASAARPGFESGPW